MPEPAGLAGGTRCPYWTRDVDWPAFPALDHDLATDVLVVGGGLTGISAAYFLVQSGLNVTLVERGRCGGFDTAATTAHLTCLTDCLPSVLLHRFGPEHAGQVWRAGEIAIRQIETLVAQLGIDCEYRRVPGFLYAAHDGGDGAVEKLADEERAMAELAVPAAAMPAGPILGRPAMRISDQAMFHPLRYLRGLLSEIRRCGGHVYEFTEAESAEESRGSWLVRARGYQIHPRYLVIATHDPWPGASGALASTLLQTRLTLQMTYVVAGRITGTPLPDGCFWDTSAPYRYLRIDGERLLIGGEDHKTGQEDDANARFLRLEELARRIAPTFIATHRWSGQVIESNDGLPLIGENRPHQFVATAFAGNGTTFGTLAGLMARDAALGNAGPWDEIFSVRRETILKAPITYLRQNADFPLQRLQDWWRGPESPNDARLEPGGPGIVIRHRGQPAAVAWPLDGTPFVLSALCPHMGCVVRWNEAERTWDCPCHGSRFAITGEVLAGPAVEPLAPIGPATDPS